MCGVFSKIVQSQLILFFLVVMLGSCKNGSLIVAVDGELMCGVNV